VLGQRLVRKLCQACREPYEADAKTVAAVLDGAPRKTSETIKLHRAVGCPACHGTGYSGRTMIAELLEVDDGIRKLVTGKAGAQEIQRAAVERGMRTMHRDGMRKALAGITTVEEVMRATQET
jgi:general secretion pathway protein E